mgnify:FL=1|jgi:hypothetical protein
MFSATLLSLFMKKYTASATLQPALKSFVRQKCFIVSFFLKRRLMLLRYGKCFKTEHAGRYRLELRKSKFTLKGF